MCARDGCVEAAGCSRQPDPLWIEALSAEASARRLPGAERRWSGALEERAELRLDALDELLLDVERREVGHGCLQVRDAAHTGRPSRIPMTGPLLTNRVEGCRNERRFSRGREYLHSFGRRVAGCAAWVRRVRCGCRTVSKKPQAAVCSHSLVGRLLRLRRYVLSWRDLSIYLFTPRPRRPTTAPKKRVTFAADEKRPPPRRRRTTTAAAAEATRPP